MEKSSSKTNCTNPQWVGRAHCEQCHIRKTMLFSELPESAFDNNLEPVNHYLYPPRSMIYEAGSDKKYVYSIRRGLVKLEYIAASGDNRIVRLLGPGTVSGIELLDGADAYLHNAITLSEVDLCKIPVSSLKQLEIQHPNFSKPIREQLQFQLKLADQWIFALGTGTAKQRVAHLILMLHRCFADKNEEFILIHRDDMAAMTSIANETISRIIAQFKREKVVIKSDSNLFSCNVPALEKITTGK